MSWASEKADARIRAGSACPCDACRADYIRTIRATIEECARQTNACRPGDDCRCGPVKCSVCRGRDRILALLEDK